MYANLSKGICMRGTGQSASKEKSVLSNTKCKDYEVFTFTAKNSPIISRNKLESRIGNVMLYCYKWENNPEQIITVYVDEHSLKKLKAKECWKLLREDMESLGIKVKRLVMHKYLKNFSQLN